MSQADYDLTRDQTTGRVLSWPGPGRAPKRLRRRLEYLKEQRRRAEARIKALEEQRAETEETLQETAEAIGALEEAIDDNEVTALTW